MHTHTQTHTHTHTDVGSCEVQYSYAANQSDELTIEPGDIINIIDKTDQDWWSGELNGSVGIFPASYVQEISWDCGYKCVVLRLFVKIINSMYFIMWACCLVPKHKFWSEPQTLLTNKWIWDFRLVTRLVRVWLVRLIRHVISLADRLQTWLF